MFTTTLLKPQYAANQGNGAEEGEKVGKAYMVSLKGDFSNP